MTRTRRALRSAVFALALTGLALPSLATPSAEAAAPEVLELRPVADTYVDAGTTTTARGGSSRLEVDGSPLRHSLLRFDLAQLAGRTVSAVTLRLHQVDQSKVGGRVRVVGGAWDEKTTWSTRPALDGPVLASFGAVVKGQAYDVALPVEVALGSTLSLGLDSTSSDGVIWTSRESTTPPVLSVTLAPQETPPPPPPVEEPPPAAQDGALTTVVGGSAGSSDPTYFSSQRHLDVTAGGRTLTVTGRHGSGLQLTWSDTGGAWRTDTTGATTTGALLTGTGTGDWPASMAVGRDASGQQMAWVVWSGPSTTKARPVQMRRLSELDAPGGPRVGPLVTVEAPVLGAAKADTAFEVAPDGSLRGCVTYVRKVGDTAWELTAVWSSDLASDTPVFGSRAVLVSGSSGNHYGSLVPTSRGLRVVARAGSGSRLQLFGHDPASSGDLWWTGATGQAVPSGAVPVGVALADGSVVAAFEDDLVAHTSSTHRFSPDGRTVVREASFTGTAQPTVTGDGSTVWLVGVRTADAGLVSRERQAAGGWSAQEEVEVPGAAVGALVYPSVPRETSGRLRLVVEGPGSSDSRSSVWSWSRPV